MVDLDDIAVGRRGTPLILILSRTAFAAVFAAAAVSLWLPNIFRYSTLDLPWILYLILIYTAAEYVYSVFKRRGIDLTFAFPLMFFVIFLHLVSIWLDGQTRFPLVNRAEHLTSYILVTYVIWVFFLQYLPQRVWHRHPYYTALLVFSVASAFGSVNEIVELILENIFLSPLIGDRFDTSLDILMNSLGSALFLAVRLILTAEEQEKRARQLKA